MSLDINMTEEEAEAWQGKLIVAMVKLQSL